MRVRIRLIVAERPVCEDQLEIDDAKTQHLSEEELESAVDVLVRDWADRTIRIEWETEEEGEERGRT